MASGRVTGERSGGRSSLVVAAVRRAVEDLVRELGAEKVTVALVAERAGVAATSIYRRWGDLPSLINEVVLYRLDPNRELPDTGDTWADIRSWAQEIARHFGTPANTALLRAGAALAHTTPSDCTATRRKEAASLAERTRAGGPTTEQLIHHLVAPIAYGTIFGVASVTPETVDRLVDDLKKITAN
ncbi:TetR/AcrR family transcriptional regulator [Amycolatopsis sp. NPDC004368]